MPREYKPLIRSVENKDLVIEIRLKDLFRNPDIIKSVAKEIKKIKS